MIFMQFIRAFNIFGPDFFIRNLLSTDMDKLNKWRFHAERLGFIGFLVVKTSLNQSFLIRL